MKMTKRLLSVALVCAMLLTMASTAFAAEKSAGSKFSDVSQDAAYADAVATLNLMGIINGYEDGSFKPEQNVTRAEFTAMLMRTLNFGSVGSNSAAALPFTDIDDNDTSINWSIPNINTAYGMGIINGYEDSTFRPSANVAYEEAVKMIVCTLGYGNNVDVSVEPWYTNYMAIAGQIGLTKKADRLGAVSTPASRACIAQLLYDSLEIELIDKGEKTDDTILSDYLGYVKNTGVIASNNVTSLTSPEINLRDNEIQITAREENGREQTYTYATTDETLKNYLGYEVEFYYKDSGSIIRTLALCVVKENKPLEINAANVDMIKTTEDVIEYYQERDDDKTKKVSLESDNVVIFNGKLYGSNAEESRFDTSMIPEVGTITLIDSDDNGKYDVLTIDSYKLYYVSSKLTATNEIVDNVIRPADDNKLKLDKEQDENLSIVSSSGVEMEFSSLKNGQIICYATSNGANPIRRAVVLTNTVVGDITAKTGNRVVISNKDYYFSPAAPWVTGNTDLEEPTTGDSGTYFLDMNGDIVAYDEKKSTENVKYGYILSYATSDSLLDDGVIFRVLTESNKQEQIGTYDKTRINGRTVSSGEDVITKLIESGELQYKGDGEVSGKVKIQQVIKYTTRTYDGHTVFDKIVTAEVGGSGDIENDEFTLYEDVYAEDEMVYNSSSKTLNGESTLKVSNAVVFMLPDDRTDYAGFKKNIASGSFKAGIPYSVEAFDVKTNVPKVIVVYGANNAQDVDYSSPIYILAEETLMDSNDGKSMTKVENAFKIEMDNFSTADAWISDESDMIDDLEIGDAFRAGTDRDGNVLVDEQYVLFDVDGSNTYGITDENGDEVDVADLYDAECVNILGVVEEKGDDTVVIEGITFNIDEFRNANILIYTESGKTVEVKQESDYAAAISGLVAEADGGESVSRVLIYMSEGDINLLYILPME